VKLGRAIVPRFNAEILIALLSFMDLPDGQLSIPDSVREGQHFIQQMEVLKPINPVDRFSRPRALRLPVAQIEADLHRHS
jgi:hypothetical protein